MKIFILAICCLIGMAPSYGHNPLSSRYYLEAGVQASILTVNLSQQGVNMALIAKLGEEGFHQLNQQELKEHLAQYIKTNFILSINGEKVQLLEGGIKLGSHQTDLKFILPPLSEEVNSLAIAIPAFKENGSHQTIFSYKINGKVDHLILSQDNNYQSSVQFSEAQTHSWLWIILAGLVGIILIQKFSRRLLIPQRVNN
jgi:hypothetical protein